MELRHLRYHHFCKVADNLLTDHDDDQLNTQLDQTALGTTAIKSETLLAKESAVMARCPDKQIDFEEGDVEQG